MQGYTGVYKGLQGHIQKVQGFTGVCKGIQGFYRGIYRGIQGYAGVYKGMQGCSVNKPLQAAGMSADHVRG